MERRILHLRITSFPIAVYRVKDPSLRDRPLIVSAGRGPRAIALSVSQEARQEGARPGMALPEALRYSRRALVLPPDPVLCARADDALAGILGRYSPLVEPAGGGRLYADLSGTRRLLGEASDVARRAQAEIQKGLGLGPSAGVGINKLVSGVATRVATPVALLDIAPGQEERFLSPLPVRHLPAVDPRTEGRLLDELNIRTVAHLREVELPHLGMAFGSRALTLYRQSRGLDDAPVRPREKALVAEADETLAEDTNDDALLRCCLFGLVERCGARLRELGLAARSATLAARYSDGVVASRRLTLASPEARDLSLFGLLWPLFESVVSRRARVRYLRVQMADLEAPSAQMRLFGGEEGEEAWREGNLMGALDRIRRRFGVAVITFGSHSAFPEAGEGPLPRARGCASPRARRTPSLSDTLAPPGRHPRVVRESPRERSLAGFTPSRDASVSPEWVGWGRASGLRAPRPAGRALIDGRPHGA